MKRIYFIALFITMLVCAVHIKAQLPSNDPAWILQDGTGGTSNLSDEFNATFIDSVNRWQTNYGNQTFVNGSWAGLVNGAELNFPTNLILTGNGSGNGTLKIKADTLAPNITVTDLSKLYYHYNTPQTGPAHSLTYAYKGGALISRSSSYKFGYLEIYAKYPSKKWSLWPAFWLQNGNCTPGSKFYNEIDIAEIGATQSFAGNRVGNNWWTGDTSCDTKYVQYLGSNDITLNVDSLSGGFHKFALQWDPHKIVFYFDDVPTTVVEDNTGAKIQQNAMSVFINFCIEPWHAWLPLDWDGTGINNGTHANLKPTSWPQYFEVDYFHYYKLTPDCSTNLLNLCTPAGYDRKVKKAIATDNTCTPTFNPSTASGSYALRATDYVLLDAGTVVNPTGTGYFAIDITACPQ